MRAIFISIYAPYAFDYLCSHRSHTPLDDFGFA